MNPTPRPICYETYPRSLLCFDCGMLLAGNELYDRDIQLKWQTCQCKPKQREFGLSEMPGKLIQKALAKCCAKSHSQ